MGKSCLPELQKPQPIEAVFRIESSCFPFGSDHITAFSRVSHLLLPSVDEPENLVTSDLP